MKQFDVERFFPSDYLRNWRCSNSFALHCDKNPFFTREQLINRISTEAACLPATITDRTQMIWPISMRI
jgi:hypothetical protein